MNKFSSSYRTLWLLMLALNGALLAGSLGYGDTSGAGYPSWRERTILVLTDACRMDPTGYRDKYVGAYTILLPATYPATYPLYWSYPLNQSSRAHAVDMANNCGLQHNSCDGTAWDARVKSYYPTSGWIGENIASGNVDPIATMSQWIMDGTTPAADGSGNDGHRANIMSNHYFELGVGYAYGPKAYNYFWGQDFGGNQSTFTTKVYGGSHLFISTGNISFMADFFDPSGSAPRKASVFVDNQEHPLARELGSASKGTYSVALAKATTCRDYYFSFTDANGKVYRYPELGNLVTSGEGTCVKEYDPAGSSTVNPMPVRSSGRASLTANSVCLFDLSGARVASGGGRGSAVLRSGVYVARGDVGLGHGAATPVLVTANTCSASDVSTVAASSVRNR